MKTLGGVSYYTESDLSHDADALNQTFDDAKLQAESGIEQMHELVSRRAPILRGWKVSVIKRTLKAAWKLIHAL